MKVRNWIWSAMVAAAAAPGARAMPTFTGAGSTLKEEFLSFFGLRGSPRVCPKGPTALGTDVSNYDPNTKWAVARAGHMSFAIIKATEGAANINRLFAKDWAGARAESMVRGAYHFFHPATDALVQAAHFLKVVGPLGSRDLPPILDWEVTEGVSKTKQIAGALEWLRAVEKATARVPIVYVGPSFYEALGNPPEFARYPLFIANYGATCPSVPKPWKTWAFWQANIGRVPGVEGTANDQDKYNGSASQLVAQFGLK